MSITATDKGGNFELVPAGNHVARCYSMIHIGTIPETYMGEQKQMNKVRISWELPTEKRIFDKDRGEQPFSVSKEYTLSMGEKANLRKDLQSWRGRPFSEEEAKAFDVTKLLGIPCMLNVIHGKSKSSGREYAVIASISGLPRGTTCPQQINPSYEFSLEKFDNEKFKALPEWLMKKIASSKEYKELSGTGATEAQATGSAGIATAPDDDLPF